MAKAREITADPAPAKEESFEASAERLGDIVKRLEGGDLPLEESLRLFEEGIQVARSAQARLEAAERRVDELLGVDDQGRPLTRPFE
ncbi:MAG: exodeoxyribonuclease VII small subunit [Deltaproteobacteria bacterium]|nr:exodeoxyribonuclease VII small subunit [Deltaproteobacteria bacterium]